MKDIGHTYIFCAMFIFDYKLNLGARLDQIRSNGIVTVVWGQYAKRAQPCLLSPIGSQYIKAISITMYRVNR